MCIRDSYLKLECGEFGPADGSSPLDYDRYPIGSLLELLPHHSCASTHQHTKVHVLSGEDGRTVEKVWEVCKGW